jgi:pilus assembly protein Flp/PilA
MKTILVRFSNDELGTAVIEYGLIAFLISIGIISALTVFGIALSGTYAEIAITL